MNIRFPDRTNSWILYDFSNSAYVLSGMTLFLPLYFATHVHASNNASQRWGLLIALSLFIVAVTAPFVGAAADRGRFRFWLFLILNAIFVLALAAMALAPELSTAGFEVMLVLATACFGLCLFLYDSLIPGFFPESEATRQSGKGWALGYLGGFACLLLVFGLLGFNLPETAADFRLTFIIVVVFFSLFSVPLLYRLAQETPEPESRDGLFSDVRKTLSAIASNRNLLIYMLCAIAMMDGLTTLTFFISIYAKSVLGFDIQQIAMLLVTIQLVAIPATMILSGVANSVGEPRVLRWIAALWMVVSLLIYFSSGIYTFYAVALLAGTLLGSTPAILRGWYARIIPTASRSRYFGFNALATRVASVLGPLVYILLASTYSERAAILSVLPFFAIALASLLFLRRDGH